MAAISPVAVIHPLVVEALHPKHNYHLNPRRARVKLSVYWKLLKSNSKKIKRRPLYLKPYWYLLLETFLPAGTSAVLWWVLLSKGWSVLFNIWPEHSFRETGWLGIYVLAMLIGYTMLFVGMKLIAAVHFRALVDRVYHDICPSNT